MQQIQSPISIHVAVIDNKEKWTMSCSADTWGPFGQPLDDVNIIFLLPVISMLLLLLNRIYTLSVLKDYPHQLTPITGLE